MFLYLTYASDLCIAKPPSHIVIVSIHFVTFSQ